MVRSGLEYTSSVWDSSAQFEINSLEKVQHRAARFVTNKLPDQRTAYNVHYLQKADARTRSGANNFKHIRTNKLAFKNVFHVRTVRDWNRLLRDVKSAPSTAAF